MRSGRGGLGLEVSGSLGVVSDLCCASIDEASRQRNDMMYRTRFKSGVLWLGSYKQRFGDVALFSRDKALIQKV